MKAAHARCRRASRLVSLAHDMFERREIAMEVYRAVCVGIAAPCEDRTCATCYRPTALDAAEDSP